MASPIQLIVGLANPGKEYANTRHNAGAWLVEQLVKESHSTLRAESKFHGLYTQAKFEQLSCGLLIPSTFINLSGRSVRACMQYHKLTPESVLIAHDDIDLPIGTIKLKFDGGDGGHNGLKDIIGHLHTKAFYRLRIGVGHPGTREEVVDYVLHAPSKHERTLIDEAIERVDHIIPLLLAGETQKAMQALHTS